VTTNNLTGLCVISEPRGLVDRYCEMPAM